MPTLNLKRDLLFKKLGKTYTDKEFDELCFQFGIELDEVVVDPNDPSQAVTYKIDIPANRYDLLCLEGLSRALLVFSKKIEQPRYTVKKPEKPVRMTVKESVKAVRPFAVTAVLRDVTITQEAYDSLIDLQEKLHHNICRKRTLVSIGIHDLDKIQPPFVYSGQEPTTINFVPLNKTQSFRADALMVHYQNDTHLKPYLHIIKDEPMYPIIHDADGKVLSLPPIINGDHSKVTLSTKNLYFEVTATDKTKANIVLDILITMLSEHCAVPFEAELTEVLYEDTGKVENYPTLRYRKEIISCERVNDIVGIEMSPHDMANGLSRMCLHSNVEEISAAETLEVEVPPTRHDVIHEADIIEDVAIAYGYDNIVKKLPHSSTIAKQFPVNKLSDQLRESIAQAGFTEALTFSLCSVEDECEKMRYSKEEREPTLARVSNPKTFEFQAVRRTLLPGVLKTISANKKMPLPLKLFEISDIVELDVTIDTGSKNKRHLVAVYYGKTPGFEVIHGLLDRIMLLLNVKFGPEGYSLRSEDDPTLFPGRGASILYQGNVIGKLGVLHPEVVHNFELSLPCSALEVCIEDFV